MLFLLISFSFVFYEFEKLLFICLSIFIVLDFYIVSISYLIEGDLNAFNLSKILDSSLKLSIYIS